MRDIVTGRIVACQWVVKGRRAVRADAAAGCGPYLPVQFLGGRRDAVCAFVEQLPHVEGSWRTETIRLEPWQVFILVACYGFRRRLDGRPLTTVVFFEVARKSAKSTLVAAVALYHLAVEREPGGQVFARGARVSRPGSCSPSCSA